jgi:hypothetical protein
MVSIGQSDEQLKKSLKPYGIEWSDSMKCSGMGRSVMLDTNQSLIRLYNYPENNLDMGTLQHEIFHCVTFIMDRIGMKFKLMQSDEAYAYLIGYLTKEIYDRLYDM